MDAPAIVLASDDNYALSMGVVVQSILENAAPKAGLRFFLVSDGISHNNQLRINRIVDNSGIQASIEWLEPDISKMPSFRLIEERKHISRATFLRLLIPTLMPAQLRRILYLDSDVLVRSDLSPLWESDLCGMPVAAVRDGFVTCIGHSHGISRFADLKIDPSLPYFNDGVLLMDLQQFREHGYCDEAARYLLNFSEDLHFHTQEGLNAVLAGLWQPLDAAWNVASELLELPWWEPGELTDSLAHCRQELMRHGHIFHFTGPLKPWTAACQHPLKPLWWQTYARTGWHAPAAVAP